MERDIKALASVERPIALVVCAGFEERAHRAADILADQGVRIDIVLLLTYAGSAHDRSLESLHPACLKMAKGNAIRTVPVSDSEQINSFFASLPKHHLVFLILSQARANALDVWILYTEAEEYYPTRQEFDGLLKKEQGEAFLHLKEYEDADLIYSGQCKVEDIPGFEGSHLPNYPLMLISFLTLKRSRLAAILREYESNVRVLIEGVPIRDDLKWRERLMEIINFDIIEDNRHAICKVETLDWQVTYRILSDLYNKENARYRFNVLLAPLGSKMQTLGAWVFASQNPGVRAVTSTPAKHFPEKYSNGYRQTFLITDIESGRPA